jgi:hypothetical protein
LEDAIVLLNPGVLLANDTDADIATDGDSLRVASVGNSSKGTVRMLGDGQIEFVPEANFHGEAGFDYVASDTWQVCLTRVHHSTPHHVGHCNHFRKLSSRT